MSAKSREKAREKGQKSGKGQQLLSKLLGRDDTTESDAGEGDDE
ncbi:hypothetical protein Halar_2369 [halophilic archaeon DL31]|jgi:hypothetical protein|nr:hypothetical protein Halar_2369 [halophilic archaeon DL31]